MSQHRHSARDGAQLYVDPRNGWVHHSTSRYQPTVGRGVAKSQHDRQHNKIYDERGNLRGEQLRETLTLDHSNHGGWGIGQRKELRASFSAGGGAWRAIKAYLWCLLAIWIIVGGTWLAWTIAQEVTHSAGWGVVAVLVFWVYCCAQGNR